MTELKDLTLGTLVNRKQPDTEVRSQRVRGGVDHGLTWFYCANIRTRGTTSRWSEAVERIRPVSSCEAVPGVPGLRGQGRGGGL